ncbi:MAG: hypothetical protein AB8C84_00650 [Oligoflexales bacterium]
MKFLRFAVFLLWSISAYGEHVAIQWRWSDPSDTPKKVEDKSEFKNQWKDTCATLGNFLRPGQGPYGWGIFSSYTCFINKKYQNGKKKFKTPWLLEFLQSSDEIVISLYYQGQSSSFLPLNNKKPLSVVRLENFDGIVSILGSKKLIPLLLANLWDQAPFVRKIKARKRKYEKISGPKPPRVDPFPLPPVPEKITLYRMKKKKEKDVYWVGTPIAEGVSDASNVTYLHSGVYVGQPTWEFAEPVEALEDLWVHNSFGALSMQKELNKRLKDAINLIQDIGLLGAIADALSMSVSSGYFGFRYGQSMVTQQFFENNMSIMSLLLEVRAGPLQGLRFYADSWPSFSLPTGVEFGGNRQVLGWAFGTDVGPFYMDLTPTFGRWSVHMAIPVDESVLPFDLKQALSVGIEMGTELQFEDHLYRFGYSKAYSIPQSNQKTEVSTARYAFDSFHKIGLFDHVESSLLLFLIVEFASFKDSTEQDPDSFDITERIEDISFPFAFSGIGVTFSW